MLWEYLALAQGEVAKLQERAKVDLPESTTPHWFAVKDEIKYLAPETTAAPPESQKDQGDGTGSEGSMVPLQKEVSAERPKPNPYCWIKAGATVTAEWEGLAYGQFFDIHRPLVGASQPSATIHQIANILGLQWNALSQEEKIKFCDTSKLEAGGEAVAAVARVNVDPEQLRAQQKKELKTLTAKLKHLVVKACVMYDMIRPGDRVLLGVSGGKDSLTLLDLLLECDFISLDASKDLSFRFKRCSPIKFELAAATVDPQTPEFDPSPLVKYMAKIGVKYHYLSRGIISQAKYSMQNDSICSFCARMKRGMLYGCCERNGYNVLALAQHTDDLVESFLMAAMHNGRLRTMKAHYVAKEHNVRIIRPLMFARESQSRRYADLRGLPVITDNCPACFESPKERQRIKMLLTSQEQIFPELMSRMMAAIQPLLAVGVTETYPKEESATAGKTSFFASANVETGDGSLCLDYSKGAGALDGLGLPQQYGAGRVLGEDFKARRRKEAKLAKQLQHREEKKKKIDFSLFKSDEVPLETFLSPEDLIPPSAQSDDHHDETAF